MSKKSVVIEDLLKYIYPENLQYSPDGTYLAFQAAKADEKKNAYSRDVWMIKDGSPKQLTANMNASIVLWDDETHLILTREMPEQEPGVTQLYRIDVTGGEAQKWLKLPFGVRGMKKIRENVYAVMAMINSDDPDAYLDNDETRTKKIEEKKKFVSCMLQ